MHVSNIILFINSWISYFIYLSFQKHIFSISEGQNTSFPKKLVPRGIYLFKLEKEFKILSFIDKLLSYWNLNKNWPQNLFIFLPLEWSIKNKI